MPKENIEVVIKLNRVDQKTSGIEMKTIVNSPKELSEKVKRFANLYWKKFNKK